MTTTEWNPTTGMVEETEQHAPDEQREAALAELVWLMTKAGPFGSPRQRAENVLRALGGEPVPGGAAATVRYVSTLRLASERVHRDLADGSVCPCCGQFAKAYRRKLNSGMARALIAVYREHGQGTWVHVPELTSMIGGDFAKLRHWGLVQESVGLRADGGRRGDWQVTPLGASFARGTVSVASHVVIYNNEVLTLDDTEVVDVRQALGSRFNYDELMGR